MAGVVTLLATLLPTAPAGSATLTGTLVSADTKAPLGAVEVVLRRAADSTVVAHRSTSADGRFRFDSLRVDHYRLRASLLGYQTLVLPEVILTGSAPDLDLGTRALVVSPISLPGVTTTTARAPAIIAPDRNLYLTKDMPAAGTGTATDILRTVPELDVDLDGHVTLRGATPTIQINGRAAPLRGDALIAYLRQMPASRIERVEVIANPSAKFDPEGTSGIVNLVLKDNVALGLSGSVNLSAGQRYNTAGGRVAWQAGPLTVFGGLSGSLYRWLYDSRTGRQTLISLPPTASSWDVDNEYHGRFGLADLSTDYAITKRATLYGTIHGSLGAGDPYAVTRYALFDSSQALASRYQRIDDGTWNNDGTSFTLGLQHVIQKGRNERDVEFLRSSNGGDNHSRGLRQTDVPSGMEDETGWLAGASGYQETSLQIDDTHPIGAQGKLELGYRGAERVTTSSSSLRYFIGDSEIVTPQSGASDYAHRERFHSGYLTAGVTVGRLSMQVGARAEAAFTAFDVRSSGHLYDHDYRSLFPSATLAWDFGGGRTVRASYSKRIERPYPYSLDPDVPSSDSLNRYVGNPALGPRYTHSWSVDASWTGSRGSLRMSPYLRETVDNWDLVTTVDANGAATSTYRNASSIRVLGASLTVSLRQTGRVGGTASLGVSREHHDASNLSTLFRNDVTGWSANGNVTVKLTTTVDVQAYLRYSPARTLAQGRASSYTAFNLTARRKLGEAAWLSLTVNDPFDLSSYSSTTGDATYSQISTTHNRQRSVSGAFSWSWGKPPEAKERKQSADAPQQDSPGPGR